MCSGHVIYSLWDIIKYITIMFSPSISNLFYSDSNKCDTLVNLTFASYGLW